MKTVTLNARMRNDLGKGASRRLRIEGMVPAVFYGYQTEPVTLAVSAPDLIKIIRQEKTESLFVKLAISDGDTLAEKLSIVKDYQADTVKKSLFHADFYEIRMDRELTIEIPIILSGQPVGVVLGGEMVQLRRGLKISALPSVIPEAVELNISGLNIGDSLKVVDVTLGEGITVLDPADGAIVTVMAKRKIVEVEAKEEAVAEEGEEAAAAEGASEE
jgi:large subunit ribosomal protein L25